MKFTKIGTGKNKVDKKTGKLQIRLELDPTLLRQVKEEDFSKIYLFKNIQQNYVVMAVLPEQDKQIDLENQQYIDWTIEKLSDGQYLNEIIKKVISQISEYYRNKNKNQLLRELKTKMTFGAIEHGGKLPASYEAIEKELTQEYLDIIAYNMMLLFKSGKD